ncbi:uncharacterized protein [Elaeis guineensis]|uniref:Uncharacterized protein LOC105060020 n=1 Tax=Elaeis guineensis var. tenera TaxID=51953 RepID=A0A6J0PSM0_ELAGV|nr:uncharacterized protein LOC105060020 [Elaeis guineensis]
MAALSPATLPAAAVSCSNYLSSSMRKKPSVVYIEGLNSFGGLKAHNKVSNLGLPACTAQSFAMVVSSLKSSSRGKKGKGGALSSTCNEAAEIFKIAAIMNGLVLIGVAVGFVLLRVEAALEEAE